MIEYLSERGKKWVRTLPPLVKAHFDNFYNMYDKDINPKGLINMGTAESHLVDNEICDLLRKSADRMELNGRTIHYNKFEGSNEFRSAIANHWQKIIFDDSDNVTINKENVAACAGCTVALETLAMLLAEPGDVFLIPAPYYSSFVDDINERAGVIPVGVPCYEDLDRESFEVAFNKVTKEGKKVKAILFSSPNNPIGTVYKEEAIKNIIDFAMDHDIDIISDEIYAQTVFDKNAKFVSTMKLVPESYRHRVHVTSSFAKDFVLSGLRTGFCISFNESIIQGFASIIYYSCVSTHTQSLLTAMLQSTELPEIMDLSRKRLGVAYDIITEGLESIGAPVMKAEAGIFVLADFSSYLDKQEFSAEHILWEKVYNELMINISPGQLFGCTKPGWFRACYAFDKETVEETCRRLKSLKK